MRILGSPHRWIKHGPFAVGLVAAVVLVLSSPVPATTAGRGLDVRVTANLTGRLGLAPVGTFVSGDELLPVRGRNKARGVTLLTNQAPKPLRFQLRGTPSLHGLDDAVRVHVELDHRPVVDTTLGRFRRWVGWNVVLAPGHAAEMLVRVRLERDTPKAVYVGQLVEVTLGFKATVVAPRSATR